MNNRLKITGYAGLVASLGMFLGDMLLYFTSQPFTDLEKELLPSMGDVSMGRLVAGGILGPLTACLYVVGFYHIYLTVKKPRKAIAMVMFAAFFISIVAGGAFHAFFPAFGIVAANGHPELIEPLLKYLQQVGAVSYFSIMTGWLIFTYIALRKQTHYPRFIVVATPLIWIWLSLLWEAVLPQPLLIVVAGGWNNLVMTLFFTVSLIVLGSKRNQKARGALLALSFVLLVCVPTTSTAQTTPSAETIHSRGFEEENPLHLVNIGDVELAVRYREGEGVPILFVHGSWDDHHSWLPVVKELTTHIDNPIILYDRRGHSASTPDQGQGCISGDVDDAIMLLKRLGIDKAHIIGHSYGANIAIVLATSHPGQVESLVIYEPPIFGLLKGKSQHKEAINEVKTAMAEAKSRLQNGEIEKGCHHFVERAAFGKGSWTAIFDERARATMTAGYRAWLDQSNDPERLNIEPQKLNDFQGKITLITGDCSIPAYPAVAKELQLIAGQVEIRSIAGAGHGGLVSHVKETGRIIEEHLKKN